MGYVVGILLVGSVAMGIGSLWYSPILFGKQWMNFIKMEEMSAESKKGMWKNYIMIFISALIEVFVLSFPISALHSFQVPNNSGAGMINPSTMNLLLMAWVFVVVILIGFIATTIGTILFFVH